MLRGVLLGLCASACWAVANVAIQKSSRSLGAIRAVLWMQVSGIAAVALAAPLFDRRVQPFDGWTLGWAALAGLAALLAYASMFYAFAHARLSVAVPVMSSWSVIAAALGVGILGERMRTTQALGAAAVVLGVILVGSRAGARDAGAGGRRAMSPGALLASVGAAVGFGVLIPAMGVVAPAAGRMGFIALVYGLNVLLGVPLAMAFRQPLGPPARREWPAVAAAGLLETAGFVFLGWAAELAPVAVVSPAASLASALTVLYAWVLLGERPGTAAALGAALASAGVVTLAL